jgi:hypothetical protein
MKGKIPGFPKLDVPGYNELRPSPKEAQPGRGPLAYVPIGTNMVHDYGAPEAPFGELYPDWTRPTLTPTSSASKSAPEAESPVTTTPAKG